MRNCSPVISSPARDPLACGTVVSTGDPSSQAPRDDGRAVTNMRSNIILEYPSVPVDTLDEDAMYCVLSGYVDLFACTCTVDGIQNSESIHLARFEKGDIYFSFKTQSPLIQVTSKLYLDSKIECTPIIPSLARDLVVSSQPSQDNEQAAAKISFTKLKHWFTQLSSILATQQPTETVYYEVIKPETSGVSLKPEQRFYAKSLLWLLLKKGVSINDETHQQTYAGMVCLSPMRCYKSGCDTVGKILSTEEAIGYLGFDLCKHFWQNYLNLLPLLIQRQTESRQKYYMHTLALNESTRQCIEKTLLLPIDTDPDLLQEEEIKSTPEPRILQQALTRVAHYFRLKKQQVPDYLTHEYTTADTIKHIASHLGLDAHPTQLETDWEKRPIFAYLGFSKQDKLWVILPAWSNRYQAIDPETGKKYRLNKTLLAELKSDAFVVVPAIREQEAFSVKQFFRHTFWGYKANVIQMLMLYLTIAVLGIIHPIATGIIVKHQIIQTHSALMVPLIGALAATSICIGVLSLIRSALFARFEVLTLYHLQSMVMMRIFKLKIAFFDHYATGDLCQRILMMDTLAKVLGPNQLGMVLSFIFSLVSLVPMMYYSWQLSLMIITMVVVSFIFLSIIGIKRQLGLIEQYWQGIGESSALIYNLVKGISRIKLFHKEHFVEMHWIKLYQRARFKLFQTYRLAILRFTLSNAIPLLSLLLLVLPSILWDHASLPVEGFVVFYTSLVQFIGGFISFSLYSNGMISAVCAYNRLKPALEAPVENTTQAEFTIHCLTGAIDIKEVFFSYPNTDKLVLNGLNCSIAPGEHIAFVGLSGSGKSTLIKLLLGFYEPVQGQICFNHQSIQHVNLSVLRQQIGTVFQDSKLFSGSILDNLIGHQPQLTEAEAWRVVELVGLKAFILSLPMKMHTNLSQHINVLSGGQTQLLLIARALVGNPRVLLLDEATNSLDNNAQAFVVQSISQLPITCISIAHRLSTVRYADRVMVMSQGKIVETGTYQELMDRNGYFYQLVTHQSYDGATTGSTI